uniref:Uncharacterized protein n=1 Tax=Triparma pacifica TaxID=91992 RepID=A0A7S2QX38_9STRA|mmetsp:Transcript_933/g.1650  ORF Transcript_933/g.1650 Transcript_933/m.1650 type:complete len:136 (+) Transcript_933:321-728(+)
MLVFFCNINREYIGTFISLQTGKELNQTNFKAGDDRMRANIFELTTHYWVGIEDDMKCWVQQNWRRWMIETPEWLDDAMKARIPIEWIPNAGDRKRESVRRSSLRRVSERRPSLLVVAAGNLGRIIPAEGGMGEQ